MAAVPIIHLFLLFFFLHPFLTSALSQSEALLKLKESFKNAEKLESWSSNSSSCSEDKIWVGLICFNGTVTGIRLGNMDLAGKIDIEALANLPGLRSISFINNKFNGPIPELNKLGALKAIYLYGNKFSGDIPGDFFSGMGSLKRIWLNKNEFTGPVPTSLSKLKDLTEFHIEHNHFTGAIPEMDNDKLRSFNVSHNAFEGAIPESYGKFDASSFAGNDGLCGTQVGKECDATSSPQENTTGEVGHDGPRPQNSGSVKGAIIGIGLLILILLLGVVVGAAMKKKDDELDTLGRDIREDVVEVCVSSSHGGRQRKSSHHRRPSETLNTKKVTVPELVVVNGEKGDFGLPDLMKAAAEVLGNGGLGSTYKAVMGNGMSVVVKRLREMNRVGPDGFEAEMRRLGKMKHKNILPPLAFYYRKEEKLLVYEYIPKGSLLYLLHGDRGPSHAELDWPTRLKIVQGIAQGMAYLHAELPHSDIPHGNLKSSNVLLGSDSEPLLCDFGFSPVVSPTNGTQCMFAYKSPETLNFNLVSPKSDVYCFGVLILEILTGKFPSHYLNHGNGGTDVVQWVAAAISERREAEVFDPEIAGSSRVGMERLLHLAATCADLNAERRPDMIETAKRVEEIAHDEATSPQPARSESGDKLNTPGNRSHALKVKNDDGESSSKRSWSLSGSFSGSHRRNSEDYAFDMS